jgi:Spy/CpxP family protein refolding chaperone
MGRLLKGLNLSTEQKLRTEGIVQGRHGDLVAGKMAVLQARRDLLTVMNGDRLDEETVRSAYKVLTAAEENLTVLRAKIMDEVMPLLTPDQRSAIRNKVAKMSLRMQRSMVKLQAKLNSPLLSDGQDNTRGQEAVRFRTSDSNARGQA